MPSQEERDLDVERVMGWPAGSCGALRAQHALQERIEQEKRTRAAAIQVKVQQAHFSRLVRVVQSSNRINNLQSKTPLLDGGGKRA